MSEIDSEAVANPGDAVERVRALVAEVEAGRFDELDAVADKWVESAGIQRVMNAIASVFERCASQDIMDRFRGKLTDMMHLAFVEGAGMGVLQIAPALARTPAADDRIAALESALRPFSEALGDIAGPDKERWPDDSTIEFDGFPEHITVGDLRRARAALSDGGDHAR